MILSRMTKRPDGIFSQLLDDNGNQVSCTLEHAFPDGKGGFEPVIPPGTYTCVRGLHRLEHMTEDFETFEITGVQGHSQLLFHWGNWNKDSDGCVLTGSSIDKIVTPWMVTNSRFTFAKFMELNQGLDQFPLTVMDETLE